MGAGEQTRQVVIRGPGQIEVTEVSAPQPGPGEVRVRTILVGVCGSDLHVLAWKHPFVSYPVMPGHEVVGIVDAVGLGVPDIEVGRRVLVEPNLVCGERRYCRSGRYNPVRPAHGGGLSIARIARGPLHYPGLPPAPGSPISQ